jgi:hypothetical protein
MSNHGLFWVLYFRCSISSSPLNFVSTSLSVLLVEENGVPGENLLSLVTVVGVFDAIFNNISVIS